MFNLLGRDVNGNKLTTQGFINYLTTKRPRFYDGKLSTYCYNTLTGGAPCWLDIFASFGMYLTVSDYIAHNAGTDAVTDTPSYPLLTFLNPQSILWGSSGRNLGNEALIFHEALHGMTHLFDSSILSVFYGSKKEFIPSCNISV